MACDLPVVSFIYHSNVRKKGQFLHFSIENHRKKREKPDRVGLSDLLNGLRGDSGRHLALPEGVEVVHARAPTKHLAIIILLQMS